MVGLGVAGAFILLITVYTRHALTMDKFSDNVRKTYRIESTNVWRKPDTTKRKGFFDWLVKDAGQQYNLVTPWILADDLLQNFPEVKEVCRLVNYTPEIMVGNQRFKEDKKNAVYVDKNFFSFFGLSLLNTTAEKAFPNNNTVVISEQAAMKYFGSNDVIGKVLKSGKDEGQLFTVSAVAKKFPLNSSMQFDVLFPIESRSDYQEKIEQGVNHASCLTLVQFQKGTDLELFRKKLASFGEEYFGASKVNFEKNNPLAKNVKINLGTRLFSNGHFNASTPWFYFTNLKSLYQLILLALIALGIACLNYVLLSLSRVASRSQETGIRKTIGANYKHILKMLLTETWVLVMLSMTASFILAVIILPYFNNIAEVNISVVELLNWKFVMIAAGLAVLLTIISGIYPAIKMMNIKPLNVLGKFSTYKLNPFLSKIFITFQYTACIVLIAFTIVMAQQIRFVNNKELGFDKEQALIVNNPFRFNKEKTIMMEEQLRQYASTQPAIAGFTGTDFRYAKISNSNGHNINGKKEAINSMLVDYDYFEFNRIPVILGRSFSRQFITDTARLDIPKEQLDSLGSKTMAVLVVNETLYNMLGRPALNEINRSLGGVIIGVCRDYFSKSLEQKIEPAYHRCRPNQVGYFWFRIGNNESIASVVNHVKQRFNDITGGAEFEYNFMDEDIKVLYESHQRWFKVISIASLMTILIACLGLFGLSAVVAANRTKEIGIRKVLGAGIIQLFYMLNRQNVIIVLLSLLIAIPIAVYVSQNWLQNFAYRINLEWSFFVLAAIIGFVCALIAVSYHTLKAANSNPVKSLRTE
jgi:putative ABC transport system permease protein